ncbi:MULTISPECIES: hypothetical protein [unclassified Pseudomonas]|uniref:hypothetical protein n=1 Tax=unclassified Pseudomonas TaxID=196821 RepID=UPI00215E9F08|nr:hypothetical protein [Pseudomonas sp. B21-015]UVM49137.1 hypothetical protein LOY38_22630 [Pseudomonas sp. B21-015]
MLCQKKLRRILLCVFFGLGLSGCYYYVGGADVYSTPYYYPGYYYSPYYYGGPRFYGGYRYFYYGGRGPRHYHGGHYRGHR